MENKKIYDLIIIGSGPAGLTAAIYSVRATFDALVIEKDPMSGGQILKTNDVDNYPGLPGINGFELGMKLREHAESFGSEFKEAEVLSVEVEGNFKKVVTTSGIYYSKAIIIATGAEYTKLGVDGEERLASKGVSYCATCDGAFFKDKTVVVVGGGDVAVEDAIFLSRMCKRVYLVHRRDELRAAKFLQDKLLSLDNVEVLWSSKLKQILGEDKVNGAIIEYIKNGEEVKLEVEGVFLAIGMKPITQMFEGLVEMDEKGYIIANENCETSIPGVTVAGDVRQKDLRQIVTAIADGAIAVASSEKYIVKTF